MNMTPEKLAELKKRFMSEMYRFSKEPIVTNENPIWVMECARVLPRFFAFVALKSCYSIHFSAEKMHDLYTGFEELSNTKDFPYLMENLFEGLHKEIMNARQTCNGIIQMFENRAKDEQKALEARLQLEADYRCNNRRY